MLGVAAPRLEFDPVLGRAVEALQRDLVPDPGDHHLAVGWVGVPLYRDDVVRPVPDAVHAVAVHDHVEIRLWVQSLGEVVRDPPGGFALVSQDRRSSGHLG